MVKVQKQQETEAAELRPRPGSPEGGGRVPVAVRNNEGLKTGLAWIPQRISFPAVDPSDKVL